MKKFSTILTAVLLFFLFSYTLAQENITVTGTVTDASNGETLPGVTVLLRGTTTGTQTDQNGVFKITAPSNGTLVFTYIGFETATVPINNQTTLSVAMQVASQQLAQVVVVGYGTQRRRDVTGSVANVSGADIARQPVQNPTQALQGRVTGVQIIGSGAPNSQPQIRVRGTGTLQAGAEPYYVVDGVLTTDIRNINPNDIVSMDILKDASSAAIYGVRGANGIIIISTKQGQTGKPKIAYNGSAGFREVQKLISMADATQYVDYLKDAAPTTAIPQYSGTTNWFDVILRNALTQNHTVSVSGGTPDVKYYVSGGFFQDDGIVLDNAFSRLNFRSNTEFQISDQIKIGTQLSYSNGNTRDVNLNAAYNDAYRAAPIIPSVVDGKYGNTSAFGNVGNPVLDIKGNDNRNIENRLLGNVSVDYKPVKTLTLRTAFNTDLDFNNRRTYNYKFANDQTTFITAGGNQRSDFSQLTFNRLNTTRWIWDNTATYQQIFDKHSITVLGGVTSERFYSQPAVASVRNVPPSKDLWYLAAGDPSTVTTDVNALGDKFTRISFLGRVNYSYAGKYLLTSNFRADGSSKFASSNRWGYFPSIGLGWVISEEDFMKNQQIFNLLKLRGTWGKLGNDQIASSAYIVTAISNIPYFFNNNLTLGSAIADIKDPRVTWETTEEYDAALEFALLDSRLTGEVSYYNKKTKSALILVNIPAILGDPNNQYITNAADISNKGVEAGLNWKNQVSPELRYSFGVNASFNKNRIVNLRGGQALLAGGVGQQGNVTKSDNGVPVGSFYVLKATGVFQTQQEVDAAPVNTFQPNAVGGLKYQDINGDNRIDAADRIFAGSYQPKMFFGINGSVNYADFDLSVDFYGNTGNKIYNAKKAFRFQPTDNIERSYAEKRWTSGNPSQSDPATIQSNTPASTYFIESGNFLRLNNITLGYTIPKKVLERAKIATLRVYATSQNLFTVTNYSGFTPELPGSSPLDAGIELNAYPTTRTYVFGVNLGF